MTACLGKSCSFGSRCVYFENVCHFFFVCVCAFPFCFEGGMCDLIVLVPDHCPYTSFHNKYIVSSVCYYFPSAFH